MNPYASFLGADDALTVLRETPVKLADYLERIPSDRAHQPWAPGKWTIREILIHLADCEVAWGFRLRQGLADSAITIQPFDQDLWSKHYAAYDLDSAVNTFKAIRHWNIVLLATVSAEERSKLLTHPELGKITLWTVVETMAGHDRNHLQQLRQVADEVSQ